MLNKVLVAFDFDHTIIEDNSDLSVRKLAPDGKLPQYIKDMYKDNDWTGYMAAIFQYIHSHGTTPEEIKSLMRTLPFVPGMLDLFSHLSRDLYEIIIISDANSVFIDVIMEAAGLCDVIMATYTNPAWFADDGCLHIKYYHTQDWCDLSTKNLCKGYILEKHIEERNSEGVQYTNVLYVGDGSNDLCPGLKLRQNDYLLPREGFKLIDIIKRGQPLLKAQVKPWKDGHDILALLKDIQS